MPSKTYGYSGEWKKFEVPKGVKILEVTLKGAGSGTRAGGLVTGKMKVDPSDALWIMVGQAGDLRHGTGDRTGGNNAFGGGAAGGDGKGTGTGGNGGGGASAIRLNTRDGRIRAVAGGAGGSGGGTAAVGGQGGAKTGEWGENGTGEPEVSEAATGGTQTQGGKGGTSSIGSAYFGERGDNSKLGRGGKGSSGPAQADRVNGGGGGGGGYYPGGGGAAGRIGYSPATGGGGGSNYGGGLYTYSSTRGTGGTGDGQVVISWIDPNAPNQPPVPPQNIRINGKPINDGLATKAKRAVTLTGTPDDPEQQQGVRLYVKRSRKKEFSNFAVFRGTYDETEEKDRVRIDGLTQDTLYYLRIHTQDNHGRISPNYRATSFWTNRSPNEPVLVQPVENAQFTNLLNITFIWNHQDPDPNDGPTGFRLRWRTAKTPNYPAGAWKEIEQETSFEEWTLPAGTFTGNTLYEWQVKTRDQQHRWGRSYSASKSFYVTAETTAPYLQDPVNNEALVVTEESLFRWDFRHPIQNISQDRADLRYRVIGSQENGPNGEIGATWTTLLGDTTIPGSDQEWLIDPDTFVAGYRYEWEVRTYAEGDSLPSDWSSSKTFWAIPAPSSGAGVDVIASGTPQRPLGVGKNRVYIYDRKGIVYRGELGPLVDVKWGRKRDDISKCTVHLDSFDADMKKFLGTLRTWQHEMVVFRDGVRVWEGPIVRISGPRNKLEIEAWDVLAYVYRRIMRQGYNDSYRILNGQQIGQRSVVDRSAQIIKNALAYDDPNLLSYLTPIDNYDDATQSRVVQDYEKTAWEEIDDMAAHAGLDYIAVGRRIVLWDTHRPIGRLPEMRDGDFTDPPIVTEYGMSAANYFGVTNNAGVWGAHEESHQSDHQRTGWIEQLASAYGESDAVAVEQELTRADREKLEQSLSEQAHRNIEGRWPPPLVVRVPDNSGLNPTVNLGINQLVPGVWIPLRATETIREVSQWQKLDSMDVEQNASGEKITVVMSPAPNAGQDPDADAAAVEDA
jgi:hypothetical protein